MPDIMHRVGIAAEQMRIFEALSGPEELCDDWETSRANDPRTRVAWQRGAAVPSGAAFGKEDAMQDIMHLIKIHASPERVYDAITTADGIRQWWTRDAAIEPKIGAAGEFGFNGKRFVAKVTVAEIDPVTRVRWQLANSAWRGNDIEFHLETDGDATILLFAHRGFPRADEGFASATTRWGFYLFSLKQYLQTGRGTPNPDDSEGLGYGS